MDRQQLLVLHCLAATVYCGVPPPVESVLACLVEQLADLATASPWRSVVTPRWLTAAGHIEAGALAVVTLRSCSVATCRILTHRDAQRVAVPRHGSPAPGSRLTVPSRVSPAQLCAAASTMARTKGMPECAPQMPHAVENGAPHAARADQRCPSSPVPFSQAALPPAKCPGPLRGGDPTKRRVGRETGAAVAHRHARRRQTRLWAQRLPRPFAIRARPPSRPTPSELQMPRSQSALRRCRSSVSTTQSESRLNGAVLMSSTRS